MTTPVQPFVTALMDEIARVVASLVDAPADVSVGATPRGRQWVATFDGSGATAGRCVLALDFDAGDRLARRAIGGGIEPSPEGVADTLRQALVQATVALATRRGEGSAALVLTTFEPIDDAMLPPGAATFTIGSAALPTPLTVAVSWTPAPPADVVPPPVETRRAEGRIDVILDIDLPVVVRFGRTELPIRALTRLGPGSVIDLGRSPDDPVEVLVSGRVVAHGEVVIVGGNYGIRILDVASPSERVRSLEA